MKLGIMGAMPEEVDILQGLLQNTQVSVHAGRAYVHGQLAGLDVVLVHSKCGKVAAATTATTLIERFAVQQLIFTGVAGAICPQLAVGDMVIANTLYQHDMDARPLFPRFQVPLTEQHLFAGDSVLTNLTYACAQDFARRITQYIPAAILHEFAISQPTIKIGQIASGDQFITDAQFTHELKQAMPETLAIEMEGAAVAQVCVDHRIPFVVLRTISDSADQASSTDFPRFIETVAKYYAQHIISALVAHVPQIDLA